MTYSMSTCQPLFAAMIILILTVGQPMIRATQLYIMQLCMYCINVYVVLLLVPAYIIVAYCGSHVMCNLLLQIRGLTLFYLNSNT